MIRLAGRDMRRHRGRSILVALLVGLPILVISAGATVIFTQEASPRETLTQDLGGSQAMLRYEGSGYRTVQDAEGTSVMPATADGANGQFEPLPLKPLPGVPPVKDQMSGPAPPASAVQAVTGGHLVLHTKTGLRITLGERRRVADALGVDGRDPAYGGMATLTSGRWPTSPDEVLVTPSGERRGIPTTGSMRARTYGDQGGETTLRIVGTATSPTHNALVWLPRTGGELSYLLARDQPVTWSEVQRLNAYGFTVRSRYVMEHPDTVQLSPDMRWQEAGSSNDRTVMALLVAGIILVTALLAGPAFASGGDRDRHALGQIGSNGATRAMLRRYVLAKAVLLGVLSATLAVLLGGALGLGIVRIAQQVRPDGDWGPPDLRWGYGAGLVLVGSIAALAAALIPAVQAGRTNLIQVLRGLVSPRRVRVGWPLLGILLCLVSGALMIYFARQPRAGSEVKTAVLAFGLFGGGVMCLPWLLSRVGQLAGRLPLTARIAARDVGRQRGRSVSGVSAVLAGMAVMTAVAIAGTSDNAQAERDYQPAAPMGHGYVVGSSDNVGLVESAVRKHTPRVTVSRISTVGRVPLSADPPPKTARTDFAVLALPPGCPARLTSEGEPPACNQASSFSNGGRGMRVASVDTIAAYADLTAAQRQRLRDGAVLVPHWRGGSYWQASASDRGPTVELAVGTVRRAAGDPLRVLSGTFDSRIRLPALHIDVSKKSALQDGRWGILLPEQVATQQGWPTMPDTLDLSAPGGVTKAELATMSDYAPGDSWIQLEQGWTTDTTWVIRTMLACVGLIVLAVTLITAALTRADGRADLTTLAAVGATGATRRKVAGAQAAVISLLGGLVGVALGLAPGIAVAYPLTAEYNGPGRQQSSAMLVVPWVSLAVVIAGTTLIAALVTAVTVRTTPPVLTRRVG